MSMTCVTIVHQCSTYIILHTRSIIICYLESWFENSVPTCKQAIQIHSKNLPICIPFYLEQLLSKRQLVEFTIESLNQNSISYIVIKRTSKTKKNPNLLDRYRALHTSCMQVFLTQDWHNFFMNNTYLMIPCLMLYQNSQVPIEFSKILGRYEYKHTIHIVLPMN